MFFPIEDVANGKVGTDRRLQNGVKSLVLRQSKVNLRHLNWLGRNRRIGATQLFIE